MQLSLITCSQCVRKVGLWGFQQIESSLGDLDTSLGLTGSPTLGPDVRPERLPAVPESPRRMMTRSQDATGPPGSEQVQTGVLKGRAAEMERSSICHLTALNGLQVSLGQATTRICHVVTGRTFEPLCCLPDDVSGKLYGAGRAQARQDELSASKQRLSCRAKHAALSGQDFNIVLSKSRVG